MTILRALIVEDSENDAELMLMELRRGGWDVQHQRVDTAQDMAAALSKGHWDVIIADYSMPLFSGPAALRMAREQLTVIPFILVSGTVGEETAVSAMRAGADDYLFKGDLHRLVPVVERELRGLEDRRRARQTEQLLAAREIQLAEALHLAKLGTWNLNLRTGHADLSEEARSLLGKALSTTAPTLGEFLECLHVHDRATFIEALENVSVAQITQECALVRHDRSAEFVHIRGRIVRDDSGKPIVAGGMIQDITQSKNIAAELCKLKESAEAANRAKSEFLANMSHELRTPMSAILGFADMMSQTDANAPDPEECIGVIRRNAHHLLQLINEILDLSKIEAGQMTVELLQCDLPTLLSDAIALMRPRAEEKALQLNIRIDGLIPRYVSTDSLKLRQIIVNLLSNAIKFTASGSIETVVRCVVGETSNQLTIEIRDMGIGMSTEQLARIFEPFVQADQSITRKFGGTGLGLTISRRLAHLLNGDVTVSSNVGLGSTFTISITAGAVANSESVSELSNVIPIAADANSFTDGLPLSANILLAEDGRDNQRLLTTHLKMAGAQVTLAENGGIAVELAAAQPFDVILMDMQMPVMDGYCATAELRRRGVKIPIIALTAYAMAEDRNKCLSSGCTDYLSKPVNRNKLLSTIRQYVGVKAAATQSNALASPPQVAGAGEVLRSLYSNYPGMAKIIVEFVNDLPEQVDTLRSLLLRQEMEPLRRLTHQLRGSCGGFGFEAITEIAAAAEDSIRAGRALQHISACIESLIEIIQRIEGYKQVQVRIAS